MGRLRERALELHHPVPPRAEPPRPDLPGYRDRRARAAVRLRNAGRNPQARSLSIGHRCSGRRRAIVGMEPPGRRAEERSAMLAQAGRWRQDAECTASPVRPSAGGYPSSRGLGNAPTRPGGRVAKHDFVEAPTYDKATRRPQRAEDGRRAWAADQERTRAPCAKNQRNSETMRDLT
jgi:hypothetical protein